MAFQNTYPRTQPTGTPLVEEADWNAVVQRLPPSGTIMLWPGTCASIPVGWMLCNGASLSQASYQNLYAAIGIMYGQTGGAGYFNLPNLMNMFIVCANEDVSGVPETNLTGAETSTGGVTSAAVSMTITQPVVSNAITQPVVALTITQPVVSAHTITQPVVGTPGVTTASSFRTSTASTAAAVTAVGAPSLSTNVAIANHTLSTNVNVTASLSTNVAVNSTLSTNVGVSGVVQTIPPYIALPYIICVN